MQRLASTVGILLASSCLWLAGTAVGQTEEQAPSLTPTFNESTPNPFRKNYLTVELTRNYPQSFSQNNFEPGGTYPAFGYRHNLDEHWLMGIHAGFKLLERKPAADPDGDGTLPLWMLAHESLYAVRLSHPTYLLMGPRMLYLVPVKAAKLPLSRATGYETEIGFALSVGVTHLLGERMMLSMRVDRWRGTRTTKFQALEFAVGMGYGL